ncbi:hypothetical protein LJB76_00795 [Clostridia bacterium OttesenSCG-928-O13]|nr:hypothetical protein [Clostridia bacterium OttesenSCG-928-O13]
MKRGYMERNATLVPDALLAQRQQALVSKFSEYGVVACVVFGDVADADELHYVSNLGPYWGNATCVLNSAGERFLVTGMTARVNFWVSMMTGVDKDHIRAAGPKVNSAVAGYLKETYPGGGAIGMVGEYFPADMQSAIQAEGFTTVWMQDVVETAMETRDEGYQKTLQKGIELMKTAYAGAFKGADTDGRTMQQIVADTEYACRKAGAMDCYILAGDESLVFTKAADQKAKGPFTLYALLQYLGEWLCIIRGTSAEKNAEASRVRDAVLAAQKPGPTALCWEENGWQIALCNEMRSDHAAFAYDGKAELSDGQIFSIRVCHAQKGILIEDMAQLGENGAVLLTNI